MQFFFNLKNVYVLRPHFGGEEKQGRGCSGLVSRLKKIPVSDPSGRLVSQVF